VAARTRIHGTKWPSNNPKKLAVDFLSSDAALRLSAGELTVPAELVGGPPQERRSPDAADAADGGGVEEGGDSIVITSKDVTDNTLEGTHLFSVGVGW